MKDLFQTPELLPNEVRAIVEKYNLLHEQIPDNEICMNMLAELKPLGYTFDYGLDYQPSNLRKVEKTAEIRVIAYPIKLGKEANTEAKIAAAESAGMVWTLDGFLNALNEDKVNDQEYYFEKYEVPQELVYLIAGSEAVNEFHYSCDAKKIANLINDGAGSLIVYNPLDSVDVILEAIDGWLNYTPITKELAEEIKKHLTI